MEPRNEPQLPAAPLLAPIYLDDLRPGDLLLFRPSQQFWLFQHLIMLVQAIVQEKDGHYDTTHVAICIGHNEDGIPMIAHVTEKHDLMGYVEETLFEMYEREEHEDDSHRPFLVFRHRDEHIARRIANIAGDPENHNKGMSWGLMTGARALLGSREINPEEEAELMLNHSVSTICSQFALESIKMAAREADDYNYYPNIHSNSTPKILEGYLYRNEHFESFCYLGKQAFETLKSEVEQQLVRIGQWKDRKSKAKHALATVEYQRILEIIEKNPVTLDELEKSLALIKAMLPILSHSTGIGLLSTTSASSILSTARRMGIFGREIRRFSLEDISLPKDDIGNAISSFEI